MNRIEGISLFSGGGISETYFKEVGIDIKIANELLPNRAIFYQQTHAYTEMIQGDITEDSVFQSLMEKSKQHDIKFMIATPPCQGMSTLGRKKYDTDERNSLVKHVFKFIDDLDLDYIFIENVPKFLKILFNNDGTTYTGLEKEDPYLIESLLNKLYADKYKIEVKVLNTMYYGVPQSRPRAIIKMYKPHLNWEWPQENDEKITLEEAIGDLPSLKPGEASFYKWHQALPHNPRHIIAMSHTSEGKSAMKNEEHYPKKADGTRVKGFHNTYKRMKWSEPAPARATNNHIISGHNNVHPGRKLPNGLQSDPRVLTLRELIVVSSLPLNWNLPEKIHEIEVRQMIGEAIPPLLARKIVEMIFK